MVTEICTRLGRLLENHSKLALLLFSVVFLGVTGLLGSTKLLEFDELFTYYPAHQPKVGDVWSFFAEGLDVHTPILALLVRTSTTLLGHSHLAVRMPMILGYWLLCLCIYAFVSYRSTKLYGMAAMMFPPITSVYFYATEARPYGVLLGVSALALVCWQRATSGGNRLIWLPLMGACLSFCLSLHYLTILLWIPFGLAGLARDWERRKVDWPIWAVLVIALFPLAVFFPMIQMARQNFLGGIWSPPHLSDIENTYRSSSRLAIPLP